MNRMNMFLAAVAAVTLSAAVSFAATVSIVDTKHNLSSGGTGSYKAASSDPTLGGTTEICIFCHTPHSGNTEAPLWNRAASAASYQTYTSDVLGGLTYPGAEDPGGGPGVVMHSKTRICLSCHDGTIALGSVVNMPSNIPGTFSEIQMQGSSMIQQSTPGYIGINLGDDHPVAIPHDNSKDSELVPGASVAGNVRLYGNTGGKAVVSKADGSYVECTSCHNPHDNQYGKFLIETNQNSALCLRCHTKTSFSSSVHADNTINVTYEPATGGTAPNPTKHGPRVGDVKCMNCHFPHKAGLETGSTSPNSSYGRYLLSYREENACFVNSPSDRWATSNASSACHGTGGAKDIETDIKSSSKHPVVDSANTSPRHKATEAQGAGWFNNTTVWHTECEDCHNPHTSGKTAHISPVNSPTTFPPALTNASPIYGVGGVNVNFPGNWIVPNPATAYTYVKPIGVTETASTGADAEYKICFKCHTAYAWFGGTVPNSSSLLAPMTDQAQEFNPNNISFHPVVQGNTGHTAGSTGLTGGWTNGNTQTMFCSDCHTRNGGGVPKGAHGSSQPFILTGTFEDSYGTVGGTHQSTSGLCSQCHLDSVYSTPTLSVAVPATDTAFRNGSGHNLHNQHRYKAANIANKRAYRCVNCHVRIPHGWQRDALIVQRNDGAPYEAGGTNTGLITSWSQPGPYTITGCGSSLATNGVTGCHP